MQLGASYHVGQKSTEKYDQGLKAAADFMNANVDEIGKYDPLTIGTHF